MRAANNEVPALLRCPPRTMLTPPAAPAPPPRRDPFLDLVRAVATVRVAVWHAYGAAAISWVIAAVPAMCFVTGDLLAGSASRRGSGAVALDRLRRIALPLWAFSALAWIAIAVGSARTGQEVPVERAVLWFVPVLDPAGTPWEAGWLASPLWYLRVLVWLLVVSPVLLWVARRAPVAGIAVGIAGVVACERLVRSGAWTPGAAPRLWWYLGDLFLYGTFLVAGAARRSGRLAWPARRWWPVALVAGVAAVAWHRGGGLESLVVNDSQLLHLLVGFAWLAVALAVESPLRRLAQARLVAPAVAVLGRRALTVYLWHTAAIAVALAAVARFPRATGPLAAVVFPLAVVVLVAVAVVAIGWVEDVAAGRRVVAWPTRRRPRLAWRTSLTGAAAVLAVASVALPAAGGEAVVHRPPVPSQRPPVPQELARWVDDGADIPAGRLEAALDELLAQWAGAEGAPGVLAGVRAASGRTWIGSLGEWPDDGSDVAADDRFDAMSVMKTFTAAAVLRAAEEGLLGLDDPLPAMRAVPELAGIARLTARDLLAHRSGLGNFRDTPVFAETLAAGSVLSAIDAVKASIPAHAKVRPRTAPEYSSANFLVLGLLLEEVYGRTFPEVLHEHVLDPLGLQDTEPMPPAIGEPNAGAGGLATTVADLLAAVDGILGRDDLIGPAVRAQLLDPDPDTAYGQGTIGFCPCGDGVGSPRFSLIGHMGGGTIAAWAPAAGVSVVLHVTDTLWVGHRLDDAAALLARMAAMTARAWPAET